MYTSLTAPFSTSAGSAVRRQTLLETVLERASKDLPSNVGGFACPFVCLPPWPQTHKQTFLSSKVSIKILGKMDRQFSKRLGKSGASSGAAGSAKGATDGKRPPSSPARGVSPVRRCYYYRHNTKPSSLLLSSPRPSLTL